MENYRPKREVESELSFNSPQIKTILFGPQRPIIEGEAAHFECKIEPVGDPDMVFTWYHNGQELVTGKTRMNNWENISVKCI